MPKFSIIIPAHNSEGYIGKALYSIIKQSYKDYELIVVCDNCSDDTDETAAAYGAKVYYTDWGCDGMARNVGIDNATGEWILFMDDDDSWLHEFCLQQIAEKIEKEKGIDVLCFSAIHHNSRYAPASIKNIAVWNKAWKRSFIGETRFSPVQMISDLYFHQAMLAKEPRYYEWDMPIYYYDYMRTGSQTWRMEQEKRKHVQR